METVAIASMPPVAESSPSSRLPALEDYSSEPLWFMLRDVAPYPVYNGESFVNIRRTVRLQVCCKLTRRIIGIWSGHIYLNNKRLVFVPKDFENKKCYNFPLKNIENESVVKKPVLGIRSLNFTVARSGLPLTCRVFLDQGSLSSFALAFFVFVIQARFAGSHTLSETGVSTGPLFVRDKSLSLSASSAESKSSSGDSPLSMTSSSSYENSIFSNGRCDGDVIKAFLPSDNDQVFLTGLVDLPDDYPDPLQRTSKEYTVESLHTSLRKVLKMCSRKLKKKSLHSDALLTLHMDKLVSLL
mmetsp:Transcript_34840/g.58322  ORF Transcript_34840/g.58322 Transcript_34840/m.58322 type:complete len:299 (+) Transcript_34840:148-1044(+)|eukprot:CAMPEP_0184347922 /NCGR_PEP_ID=MMETSP1089-20130417/23283_1 /TAXON_ID=38269 ORGANISM="Gloeochaete wittrockiana, Strain SAG46.84" /NCGR_SAMPLE_ID=MMETSP1089 /ASSEMBLY_ACC=CAM_ASM_000445 /LENGTH=298 /DNA_ID=CAMNT_0026679327 /DNA_START=147 /DNA_END=1043 /DNA_ORIENTATION=-